MPTGLRIYVIDGGLPQRLTAFADEGLIVGSARGVATAAKQGVKIARAEAPHLTGEGRKGIAYKIRGGGPVATATVFNKVYYMRYQAAGTGPRYTADGAYRGIVKPHSFMRDAFQNLNTGVAKELVEISIGEALAAARL